MNEQPTVHIALRDFTYLGRRYRAGETVDLTGMPSKVSVGLIENGRIAPVKQTPVPAPEPNPEGTPPAPEEPATEPASEPPTEAPTEVPAEAPAPVDETTATASEAEPKAKAARKPSSDAG